MKNWLFQKAHLFVSILLIVLTMLLPMQAFAWDASSITYDSVSYNVQDFNPSDVFFKPDGTKMYVMTRFSNKISQYSLSTPWSISSASYDSKQIDVSGLESTAEALFFKSDGTVMYIGGQGHSTVYQYTLSTPWDISTATYASKSFSITSQSAALFGLFFKPDGSKMYAITFGNSANAGVYQYSLSTAWDVSTASYDNKRALMHSQDDWSVGVAFNSGGTKMYMLGATNLKVYQYSVATPWDVSSVSYDSVSTTVNQDSTPWGFTFKPDGRKMYIAGYGLNAILQYSLTDATVPTAMSFSPIDGSTGVSPITDLTINFSESVNGLSGNILIKKSSDNSIVQSIGGNSARVTGSGSYIITVDPSDLEANTDYYIQIQSTAFSDLSNNAYAGIADTTSWNFRTGDSNASPSSSSSSPSSQSSGPPQSCNDIAPGNSPYLFQTKSNKGSATLYFVPVSGQNTGYVITYGPNSNADMYAVSFNYSDRSGAIPYTVNALFPGTWYFKVRGQNGCHPGTWSAAMSVLVK